MLKKLLNIFAFTFMIFLSQGQEKTIDSLVNVLSSTHEAKLKVELLIKLSKISTDSTVVSDFVYQAKNLIRDLEGEDRYLAMFDVSHAYYKLGELDSSLIMIPSIIVGLKLVGNYDVSGESAFLKGKIFLKKAKYDSAIVSYLNALNFFREAKNISRQIDCLNGMGVIHKNLENYVEALALYHEAYNLSSVNNLENKLASTSTNIGVLLKIQGLFDESLKYYGQAETIYLKKKNNSRGLANIYNNIGNVRRLQKKYDEALKNYYLSIENRNKVGTTKRLSYTYNNIAIVYQEKGNYEKAIEYLELSAKLKEENEEFESLSSTHLNFSEIFLLLNDKENFTYHSNEARRLAFKYNQLSTRRSVLILMSKFAANNKEYKKAYVYLSSVYDELDTLNLEEQDVLTSVLQAQFERDKSKNEILELSDAVLLLDVQKVELEKKQAFSKKLIIGLLILVLGFVVLSILFYFKHKALKRKTEELAFANEQILATTISIEEKELLLKEIHHRVKNNLQIIKSLVRLQNTGDTGTEVHTLLQDFELRVSSMAYVHESLYKSGDFAKIDVPSYYKELIDNLIAVYNLHQLVATKISININELGIDTLVPLGLVSTEIVSNSLKYGVAPESDVTITVNLEQVGENEYELYIGDDGRGFDMDQVKTKNTLGIELIYTLVEQLDGEISFSNENGAYYKITFKGQEK